MMGMTSLRVKVLHEMWHLKMWGWEESKSKKTPKISVHFRLGDYKHKQQYHPILPYEYYRQAFLTIQKKGYESLNEAYIYVFYEQEDKTFVEEERIKRLAKEFHIPETNIIRTPDDYPDWKQMLMMSNCDANIIANSSFSWWAAYLNNEPNRCVVYPSVWFGPALKDECDTKDLFPEEWHKCEF